MVRRNKYNAQKTKQQLLEIALKLFAEKGYHETTIDEICAEAGFTKGAFYNHFSSKSEVILNVWKIFDEDINLLLSLENSTSTKVKLVRLCRALFNNINDYAKSTTQVIYSLQINEKGNSLMLSNDRYLYRTVYHIVKDGIENNEIRNDLEIEYMTDLILVMIRGIVFNWTLTDKETLGEDDLNYFNTFLDSILN